MFALLQLSVIPEGDVVNGVIIQGKKIPGQHKREDSYKDNCDVYLFLMEKGKF